MSRLFMTSWLALWMFCLSITAGSAREVRPSEAPPDSDAPAPLVFILPPVENVSVMYEKFLPLSEYLEKELYRPVVLRVAQNYQEAIESIGTGKADLSYLDPSAYCEARHLHRIFPLVKAIRNGSATYRSVIVARKDSGLRRIVEAKGKRFALGNVSSSSSYLIPAVMFKEVGIGLSDFASVDYLEQEDRIALSVLARRHDIGGLSERVARKYEGDGLAIINESEAIPQYTLCASPNLPAPVRAAVRQALLVVGMSRNPALIAAMKDIDGFAPAEERDFDVVRVMIKNLTGKNYLEYGRNAIKVAILPLYSAITLFDRFDPLMRYLSQRTGAEFKLVIPRDFEDFFDTVRNGSVQFSYSNPYIYIQLADHGYVSAFANTVLESSGDIFRGIIIARRESPIATVGDLRGKRVMVVSYKSAGGFLAQKLLLNEQGIDVFRELRLEEGKRQEEVILNVYRKNVDAGFVRESALDVLKEEIDLGQIKIVARTPYIANWPFASTRTADPKIVEAVRKGLLELSDKRVLAPAQITAFKAASDRDFDGLRKRIWRYEDK
ncbi:MAG TPA: phosphate/phosphite/phosphonate ABC transporter substrate-binding protein [Nitrospirota bacterium]|nr:phosphate/phosphite/phosphonate ABC transporter substrate-binding protein [Nitrospirota bacterium]